MTDTPEPLLEALRAALGPAYDIESELSGGGMSRVFVATERALNRRVVVKVLPPDLAAGVNRERFRREIQLAAQLQHPHIVPLLSAGDTEGVLYYTMPFIEGESLKHALAHGTKYSTREVISILLDVVDALAYAHARGVVHRDVKPANVLRSGVHAVVADFGVAKAISAALPAVGMTTSGMAIGTPQYMAPEQLAGDPAADHRMDIYALGLLGYELLTGAPTFSEASPQATLAAQLTRNPAPLKPKRPDVPDALAGVLMRCLAKEPANRPATALAVKAELEEIVMPSGDYPPRVAAVTRRPRWVIPAAVIAVAAAAVVIAKQFSAPALPDLPSIPPVGAGNESTLKADSLRVPTPPPSVATTAPPPKPKSDSSGGRRALAPSDSIRPVAAGSRRAGAPPRGRTAADSLAEMTLLLKAQAPGDPIVRMPSAGSISQAALEERRRDPGPARKALLVSDPDSVSRTLLARVARALDPARFQATVSDAPANINDRDALDTLARRTGNDVIVTFQAPMRRDSSWQANVQLRDLTAHPSYATGGASRRIVRDSIVTGADSLAVSVVRRLVSMDRAPRADAIDPEVRAFTDRARNPGPPRRLVIWNHPPHDNLAVQEAGSVIMDALRIALRGSTRFAQVPRDSTLELLARSRNRETVLAALKSDVMVSIAAVYSSQQPDSVSWVLTVRDVGAIRQYEERSFRSANAPISTPTAFTAATLARVMAALEQMDTAPRKAP